MLRKLDAMSHAVRISTISLFYHVPTGQVENVGIGDDGDRAGRMGTAGTRTESWNNDSKNKYVSKNI